MRKKSINNLNRNLVNWNHVYYFTKVASIGSIKDAAENLKLKPSTLSEHISQLETDLNIELFYRKHRKLVLTKDGVKLFNHSKEMFEVGQRFLDILSPLHLGDYPVTVGLLPNLTLPISFDFAFKYLLDCNTNIHFSSHGQGELETLLDSAKLDFALSSVIPENKNIHYKIIEERNIQFYVNKKYKGDDLFSVIRELPLIAYNAELKRGGAVEKLIEQTNIQPKKIISSDFTSQIVDLCTRGVGVAMLSNFNYLDHELKILNTPHNLSLPNIPLFALWSKNSTQTKSVANLLKIIDVKSDK